MLEVTAVLLYMCGAKSETDLDERALRYVRHGLDETVRAARELVQLGFPGAPEDLAQAEDARAEHDRECLSRGVRSKGLPDVREMLTDAPDPELYWYYMNLSQVVHSAFMHARRRAPHEGGVIFAGNHPDAFGAWIAAMVATHCLGWASVAIALILDLEEDTADRSMTSKESAIEELLSIQHSAGYVPSEEVLSWRPRERS
jgi:hypothetical protein